MSDHNENRAISIYILGYISLIILQFGLVLFTNIDFRDEEVLIRVSSIMNLGFYGVLATLMIVLFIPFWKNTVLHFKENKKQFFIIISIGILGLFVASLAINQVYEYFGITDTSENQEQLNQLLNGTFFDKFSLVLFAIFFAPLAEEMVFRMALFKYLYRIPKMKTWFVIIISSLIFGLIHVLSGDYVQIFYYAGLGAVLGYLYHRSNNIIVPIAVHMLLNGFVTISMLFFY